MSGEKFGRWIVIGIASPYIGPKSGKVLQQVLVRCTCGTEKIVLYQNLVRGLSKSCGCLRQERSVKACTTHGMSKTKIYGIWSKMLHRCENVNYHRYKDYGGMGIKVCTEWHKFENFYADMGDPPNGKTLDRIDNNGDYCAANCRWASPSEQGDNRRSTVLLCVDGVVKPLTRWAKEYGIARHTLANRIRLGWSHKDAVATPVRYY